MEDDPSQEIHPWILQAARGDEVLLGLLLDQDAVYAEMASMKNSPEGFSEEDAELLRAKGDGLRYNIKNRQLEIGLDPITEPKAPHPLEEPEDS